MAMMTLSGDDKKTPTTTTTKTKMPVVQKSLTTQPPATFDSAGFEKEIVKHKNITDSKGNVKKYAFDTKTDNVYDKTGKVTGQTAPTIHYPGSMAPHVKALAEKLKGNLEVLENEKKKKGVSELSEEESDTALKNAGRGDYATHKVNMEQQNRVRALTPYKETALPTKVDIVASNRPGGDAGMGGMIKMSRQTPYDSTQQIYSKPLTMKLPTKKQ